MEGTKLLESIGLQNILSFGTTPQYLKLEPLNVLIGPNGVGKSNLIEALSLLQSMPSDFVPLFRSGGGASEWVWKGKAQEPFLYPTVDVIMSSSTSFLRFPFSLHYGIQLSVFGNQVFVNDEVLESAEGANRSESPISFYRRHNQEAQVLTYDLSTRRRAEITRKFRSFSSADPEGIDVGLSILAQLKDRSQYPELTFFATMLTGIRVYRGFDTHRSAAARLPQLADLPDDYLLEDASNLGLVLNLMEVRGRKRRILEYLQKFYEPTEDFTIRVQGGTVQFYLHERGLSQPISSMRLSDGTLHFLYLLAILLHPTPPPLICIEEPEIGLHPDVIPTVAELLVEASQRTQLIVTTHSDALVSALSATPEAIVVCERDEDGTQLRRLEPDQLKEWLERYTLGDLWHMGEIGGTRW
jgi:predicted ATPase